MPGPPVKHGLVLAKLGPRASRPLELQTAGQALPKSAIATPIQRTRSSHRASTGVTTAALQNQSPANENVGFAHKTPVAHKIGGLSIKDRALPPWLLRDRFDKCLDDAPCINCHLPFKQIGSRARFGGCFGQCRYFGFFRLG